MTDIATSPLLVSHQPSNASLRLVPIGADKSKRNPDVVRYTSLVSAILSCLCAGSITTFSLYGHLFLTRLKYTQTQVNTVALGAQITLCLSVSFVGYLCDRFQPATVSLLSAVSSGVGYVLAAFTYRNGTNSASKQTETQALSVWIMVIAFIMIGLGTTLMYLSSITTCAKNFRNDKHRGLALASPIAAIGLSGLWQSQLGSRIFVEYLPDGSKGDVDVFKYFIFLALILIASGLSGFFLLKIVDEDHLIEEAIERLERSRLLEDSEYSRGSQIGYGTTFRERENGGDEIPQRNKNKEEKINKAHLLNLKTAIFIKDPTMWLFSLGFLVTAGSADAFITNLGTIIGTLNPPAQDAKIMSNSAATQVSLVSLTSTAARLIFGSLADTFAPALTHNSEHDLANSEINLQTRTSGFSISRMTFLIGSGLLLSAGQAFLAAGLTQSHADRFWIVSVLIGFGYGAVYTLSPLIVSIVWGVENFGTNWGIMATTPVLCIAFWDLIYSLIYDLGAKSPSENPNGGKKETLCYGKACYSITYWAMAITVWIGCVSWLLAWKGRHGWIRKGVSL